MIKKQAVILTDSETKIRMTVYDSGKVSITPGKLSVSDRAGNNYFIFEGSSIENVRLVSQSLYKLAVQAELELHEMPDNEEKQP